jgi:carbon-monoxide dehydrogenase medium subunit
MIPVPFDYTAPKSLDEAVSLLEKNGEARVLAGGHDLLPKMKLRQESPGLLVDLRLIPGLGKIERRPGPDGSPHIFIGAMVTCNQLAANPDLKANASALVDAANSIGDVQVRNAATIGGNLACGDPGADLAAAALVLGLVVHTVGAHGSRAIGADEFFVGPFKTALSVGEIIKEISLPLAAARSGSAYEKIKHPASGYPLSGVAAQVVLSDKETVAICRVAATGAASHPMRLREVENALTGAGPTPREIANVALLANRNVNFVSDLGASGDYRANLTRVLTERALARATTQAEQR